MVWEKILIIHVLLPHWGTALPEMLFCDLIKKDGSVKSPGNAGVPL